MYVFLQCCAEDHCLFSAHGRCANVLRPYDNEAQHVPPILQTLTNNRFPPKPGLPLRKVIRIEASLILSTSEI